MSTQRLVKTFCDLVSTGSETGHELAFCIGLEKALIEAGFEVERDEEAGKKCGSDGFNIYGYLPGEGESVLLSPPPSLPARRSRPLSATELYILTARQFSARTTSLA